MKVRTQYFAIVRELANRREDILDVPDRATVMVVLGILAKTYGTKFRDYVFDPRTGTPKSYLQFLLDGNSISNLDGLSTVLRENSELVIIPPVGGG